MSVHSCGSQGSNAAAQRQLAERGASVVESDSLGADAASDPVAAQAEETYSYANDSYDASYATDEYKDGSELKDAASAQPVARDEGGMQAAAGAGLSAYWEQVFTELQLPQEDMDFLRTANFTDAELQDIATSLAQMPLVETPVAGETYTDPSTTPKIAGTGDWNDSWTSKYMAVLNDLNEVTKIANADLTTEELGVYLQTMKEMAAAQGNPGTGTGSASATQPAGMGVDASAWNTTWESKFSTVLRDLGLPEAEVKSQIAAVRAQTGITTEQLTAVYDQLKTALGDWDSGWSQKFGGLMDKLKVPADQKQQTLSSLAQRGLKDAELQKLYDSMAPGWDGGWEVKFKTLNLSAKLIDELGLKSASKEGLQAAFDKMLDAKLDAKQNGRLEQLQGANATDDEKWMVLLADPKMDQKQFDTTLEAIRSSHVPLWQRGLSIAANFIPFVGLANYAFGKDLITGEHIDRSNPLNIAMAGLSVVAGVGMVAKGVKIFSGLTSATGQAAAGAMGLTKPIMGVGGIVDAAAAGNVVSKISTLDKLLAATPVVNRFGKFHKLAEVGMGAHIAGETSARLALQVGNLTKTQQAAMSALAKAEGSKALFGKSATELAKIAEAGGAQSRNAAKIIEFTKAAGLSPSQVMGLTQKLAAAEKGQLVFKAGVGNFRLNPFANHATATLREAAEATTRSGIGRVTGAINDARHAVLGTGAASVPTLQLGRGVTGLTGLSTAGFARVAGGLTGSSAAGIATNMGMATTGVRTLAQILPTASGSVIREAIAARNAGKTAYELTSGIGGVLMRNIVAPTATMLAGSTIVGMSGRMTQPVWDEFKNRDTIAAEQAAAEAEYDQELADLQRLQAERGGQSATPAAGAQPAMGSGTVQTPHSMEEASAMGFVLDQEYGILYHPQTGWIVDPNTWEAVDPATLNAAAAAAAG